MNVPEAVMTGVIGWLLARMFKRADGLDTPSVPAVPTPHPAAPPSPTTVPWPRGETSVPAPSMSTPADALKATAAPVRPYAPAPHILLPSGQKHEFKREGAAVPQTEEAAVIARERKPFDRTYWRPKRRITSAVAAKAKALLSKWHKGGVYFDGPRSFAGRVQYRMATHGGKKAVEAWEPAPPFV